MYLIEIAEVKPNSKNEAEVIKVRTSKKVYYGSLEEAIQQVKNLVAKETPPPNTFFKVHGNGSLAYTDALGNPLPIRNWEKFAPALCEARKWKFIEEKMIF